MKEDQIEPHYIDPERDVVGIIVDGACYEVTKESLQKFCDDMQEILPKQYKKYTYLDKKKKTGEFEIDVVLRLLEVEDKDKDEVGYSIEGEETIGDIIYYNEQWGVEDLHGSGIAVPYIKDFRPGYRERITYLFDPKTKKLFGICHGTEKYKPFKLKNFKTSMKKPKK